MLAANVAAAEFLHKNDQQFLYRIHDEPPKDKLKDLKQFLDGLGLKFSVKGDPQPQHFSLLLKQIEKRSDFNMIQTVLLRSLSQASYSPKNCGHFGLAFGSYTHFASPIRRYADLLVHRAIGNVLKQKSSSQPLDYVQMGEQCSMTERRADMATRDANHGLKCEYMVQHLGDTFSGVITGVTGFGVFIMLENIFIEGLLHISSLKDDYYVYDSVNHALKGEVTGQTYRLSDKLTVNVDRVDVEQRQIDFSLAN